MIHAALLVAALTSEPNASAVSTRTPIQRCFATMDGAVYHGDPSNRPLMKANVAVCEAAIAQIGRMPAQSAQGPEKLFLTGRILDRAATLTYMGLGDTRRALGEVRRANLYFRIAAGLPDALPAYRTAALVNAELTAIQLRTLRADIAFAQAPHGSIVASRLHSPKRPRTEASARLTSSLYTAYHKL